MRAVQVSALAIVLALAAAPLFADQNGVNCGEDDLADDQIIVQLEPGASIEAVLAAVPYALEVTDTIPRYRLWLLRSVNPDPAVVDAAQQVLKDHPSVHASDVHPLMDTPEGVQRSIPDLGITLDLGSVIDQTPLALIRVPQAQQQYTGAGVTVAVLDTGFALGHALFAGRMLAPGADFAGGNGTAASQPNGVDDDGDGDIDESLHHGTFVAGLIHLVAPGAAILPVRVLEEDGKGTAFGVAKGILYALDNGADVINLSLGLAVESIAVERAIEDAQGRGVVVVAAAGNRGTPCVDAPANAASTVGVAAVDSAFVKTDFTSYGNEVDLTAPAQTLFSAYGDDGFAAWGGTSFATPLVSGAVALLLERYPGLTPAQVLDLLRTTAQPDANPPTLAGLLGSGVLDLEALTQALTSDRTSLKIRKDALGAVVSWSPVLSAATYDVVRGTVAGLAPGPPQVSLGPLWCVANDLALTETSGTPDADVPDAGVPFFYLFRDDAPDGGDYGTGFGGFPFAPGAGDCPN